MGGSPGVVGEATMGVLENEQSLIRQPFRRPFRSLTYVIWLAAHVVNGKKVRGRRRYQMIDNIMINGPCADTERKAEKSVKWRILSLQ